MADKNYPTKEELHELFEYREGNLYWKKPTNLNGKVGTKAGALDAYGYLRIQIKCKGYKAHRLIFLMHHNYLPKYIDHIDCNRLNNKIENLRPITSRLNIVNQGLTSRNKSGYKNVSYHNATKKWIVGLKVNGKSMNFGYFDDLELAILVATEARIKYFGEFANHG